MDIPPALRALVESAPLAHLTTLNADGSPQVTVVWVGIEDGELVTAHLGRWRKVRNVERDPRVALSFLGTGTNAAGLREYGVIYGEARISEGGAAALLQRLARGYIGPDVEFPPPALRDKPGFITRIRPTRIAGVGPWAQG
jgi:PPOX class probable F420-dependent enzyme